MNTVSRILFVVIVVISMGCRSNKSSNNSVPVLDIEEEVQCRSIFNNYCASCHGLVRNINGLYSLKEMVAVGNDSLLKLLDLYKYLHLNQGGIDTESYYGLMNCNWDDDVCVPHKN